MRKGSWEILPGRLSAHPSLSLLPSKWSMGAPNHEEVGSVPPKSGHGVH